MTGVDPQKPPSAARGPFVGFGIVVLIVLVVLLAGQEWRWRSSTAQPSAELQLAERAFQRGDNKAALSLFSKLADQNNPTAEYWLAQMSELGLGVPRDPDRAVALYKKAADHDVVAGQLRLGEIYLHGNLVLPDPSQAKSYLEKAAYHGDAQAAMLLGQMFRAGLNVPPDKIQSYAWSEVATLEGDAFAKSERDSSLVDMSPADQQTGITRAHDILDQIKGAATSAAATSLAHPVPAATPATASSPPQDALAAPTSAKPDPVASTVSPAARPIAK